MSFAEFENEEMRLSILVVLDSDSDYSMNDSVILRALESLGYKPSSDKLVAELHWLKELSLIDIEQSMGFTVAKLTRRGSDVAQGRSSVPGIPRPRPNR
ncbi:MAG: ArsR family transcriptional regulator [Oceanospirillaceae bacterium]|nr:ArsR family transcriptional regulator [Oceanospirillaceae bacterium]